MTLRATGDLPKWLEAEAPAKKRKGGKKPEHALGEQVYPYLRRALPLLPGRQYAAVYGIDNGTGAMADYVRISRAKRGVVGKISDYFGAWEGGRAFWETKVGKGKLTDGQEEFQSDMAAAGIPMFVITHIEGDPNTALHQIEASIRSLGLTPRMTADQWWGLHNLNKRGKKPRSTGGGKPRKEQPNKAALRVLERGRARGVFV